MPGPAIAVVGSIVCSWAFDFAGQGITVLGPITGGLPRLGIPQVTWAEVVALLPVAGACFVMILAQSAATAGAYATRHRQSHDENADLLGLSMANVGAALSGAFVVNGSPTQTAMVERSGGTSQVAHLTTAAVVGLVLLFLTGPLHYLPRCALSAVVFTVALGLIDLGGLRDISRESPGEFQLALGTALVVVLVGVEQGILLAMLVSLLRHVRHSYRPHTALLTQDSNGAWRQSSNGDSGQPGLLVFQFGADLFYANSGRFAEEVRRLLHQATSPVKWLIIDAGAMTSVDYSAARVLRQLHEDLCVGGVTLVLVHAPPPLLDALKRHRLSDVVAPEHIFDTLHEALAVFRQRI